MKYFKPKIYLGTVFHRRLFPKVHQFSYSSFFIKLSLINFNQSKNLFFSINRFNLFSFHFKDHGNRDGTSLIDFAKNKLLEKNISTDFDDLVIHTYPRILGFVFNPVSFWSFYKNGSIYARLAEVNNTFGGTHTYVLLESEKSYRKVFHVSPFNQIEGEYQFKFVSNDTFERVEISYFTESKLKLLAFIEGMEMDLNTKNIFLTFLKSPLHNFAAVFFIHFEAIILFTKKIPFFGTKGEKYDHSTTT